MTTKDEGEKINIFSMLKKQKVLKMIRKGNFSNYDSCLPSNFVRN